MRTETKVGIVAGFVIALLVVIYIVASGTKSPLPDRPTPVAAEKDQAGGEKADQLGESVEEAESIDARDSQGIVTVGGIYTESTMPEEEEAEKTVLQEETARTPAEKMVAMSAKLDEVPSEVPKAVEPGPTKATYLPVRTEIEQPQPDAGKPQLYTVQKGDMGFWYIAQKVYKDGSKWHLIANANPQADSNNLRPRQKLVIPPLPKKEKPGADQLADVGKVIEMPSGQRMYVVKKGDKGFWGVATKVYRDGGKWHLIANANPDVNTLRLHPGMKLVIPQAGEAVRPVRAVTTTGRATPSSASKGMEVPSDGRPRFYDVVRPES